MNQKRWDIHYQIEKDTDLVCFVTGQTPPGNHDLLHSLSGWVDNEAAGHAIAEMFGGHAKIESTFKENDIFGNTGGYNTKVTVGVSEENLLALQILQQRVRANNNNITPEIIAEAKEALNRIPKTHEELTNTFNSLSKEQKEAALMLSKFLPAPGTFNAGALHAIGISDRLREELEKSGLLENPSPTRWCVQPEVREFLTSQFE